MALCIALQSALSLVETCWGLALWTIAAVQASTSCLAFVYASLQMVSGPWFYGIVARTLGPRSRGP